MRKKAGLVPVIVFGVLFAIGVGCKSDARPAFSFEGGPSSDTGPMLPQTSGGDAAGTFNLPKVGTHGDHGAGSDIVPTYGGNAEEQTGEIPQPESTVTTSGDIGTKSGTAATEPGAHGADDGHGH